MFLTKPEIKGISAWINSKPLTLEKLKGKVVLVDFWTYTCVNCIRTLPYIKQWHEKYSGKGLAIIGVSTPEFEFEKELKNVKAAVKKFGLKYPIALDNDFGTWHAFGNMYWPAKYLFDKQGNLVYSHFGEGNYKETEEKIVGLLELKDVAKIQVKDEGPKFSSMFITPETYCGSSRNNGLGSSGVCKPDGTCAHIDQGDHERGVIYLNGEWKQDWESVETESTKESYILMKYVGSEINLVIRSAKATTAKIYIDGKMKGNLKVDSPKMYNLHKTEKPEEHELKLVFKAKGVKCYAYTFG